MKIFKINLIAVTLGFAITSPLWAHEGVGSGVRGGGHVIEVDGKAELVDLVTSATCDWYSGEEVLNSQPEVSNILKKIAKIDWYLALELKREIKYISWCMTGKLYSVPVADEDSFVQQLTRGVQQAAFRLNESAYIDQGKFEKLSPSSRAYLILHETLHSYVPMNLGMRRFKLMSLVATLQKVDKGQITTRKALHLNLGRNEMDFPLSVSSLDPFKKDLLFLLGTTSERVASVLAEDAPEKLIPAKLPSPSDLLGTDAAVVRNPMLAIDLAIRAVLRSDDLLAVKRVLHGQTYEKTNPAGIALTIFDELDPVVQKEILASSYLGKVMQSTEDFLSSMTVTISNSRILGDKNIQSLSTQAGKELQNLTSLSPSKELPIEIESLGAFITKMTQLGQVNVLQDLVFNNEGLIQKLKLSSIRSKLDGIEAPINREKALAKLVVQDLQKTMVKNLSIYIEARVSAQNFKQIKTFINKLYI